MTRNAARAGREVSQLRGPRRFMQRARVRYGLYITPACNSHTLHYSVRETL